MPYSFEGARMACPNNCVIAEGYSHSILPNRRSRVIHGMRTSGGCPLYSTLNDTDGVNNQGGAVIPLSFVQDHDGEWVGDTFAEQTGKRFLGKHSETGEPLPDGKFVAVVAGKKQEGITDKNGYAHVDAKDGDSVDLQVVFQASTGPLKPHKFNTGVIGVVLLEHLTEPEEGGDQWPESDRFLMQSALITVQTRDVLLLPEANCFDVER